MWSGFGIDIFEAEDDLCGGSSVVEENAAADGGSAREGDVHASGFVVAHRDDAVAGETLAHLIFVGTVGLVDLNVIERREIAGQKGNDSVFAGTKMMEGIGAIHAYACGVGIDAYVGGASL